MVAGVVDPIEPDTLREPSVDDAETFSPPLDVDDAPSPLDGSSVIAPPMIE
jgi:hypothetical protein